MDLKKIFDHPDIRKKLKIAMTHHHFAIAEKNDKLSFWENLENHFMKLSKRKKIIHFLKHHRVKLVLHGHVHESQQYRKKGLSFANAGGSIESKYPEFLQINFIDVQGEEIKIEIKKIPKVKFHPKKYFINKFAFSS